MPKNNTTNNKCGKAYPAETVAAFQRLAALRKAQKGSKGLTMGQIQKKLAVGSRATLYRWAKMDMKLKARTQRQKRKGHRRLLTEHEETILAGLICVRSELGFDTSANYIETTANEAFGIHATARWVHDFAKRNDLSARTAKAKEHCDSDVAAVREMVKFLKRIRALKKEPNQIACLDKTGVYNTAVYRKQYGPKNR